MEKLTSFVVEDNSLALEMLVNDISNNHPEIEVIGTAKSVIEAAKLLQRKQPDILFLDITKNTARYSILRHYVG